MSGRGLGKSLQPIRRDLAAPSWEVIPEKLGVGVGGQDLEEHKGVSQLRSAEMGVLCWRYRAEIWNRGLWVSRSCALGVPKEGNL